MASNQLLPQAVYNKVFIGELGLDGSLKSVKGSIITAIDLELRNQVREEKREEKYELILPKCNLSEVSVTTGVVKKGSQSLIETIAYLKGRKDLPSEGELLIEKNDVEDITEVKGQEHAKKAFLIAGCGGHNVLMIGPPGCGKSLLAKNFKNLLPDLTFSEKLEVLKIYSVSGLPIDEILLSKRPFRAPHHSASTPGVIGGGSPPRPGEISLAHRGILFFDEIPEFPRQVLEALRAPLEDGVVRIVRAKDSQEFPANFQFIAAMNPCPCGKLGMKATQCGCSVFMIQNYVNRISQPIMDRIDMHLQLNAVPIKQLINTSNRENLDQTKEIIAKIAEKQIKRQGKLNSELTPNEIHEIIRPNKEIVEFLDSVAEKMQISARGCFKILKVAKTIADITSGAQVVESHVSLANVKEAIGYRRVERYAQNN